MTCAAFAASTRLHQGSSRRRAQVWLWLAVLSIAAGTTACGKYGPPQRGDASASSAATLALGGEIDR